MIETESSPGFLYVREGDLQVYFSNDITGLEGLMQEEEVDHCHLRKDPTGEAHILAISPQLTALNDKAKYELVHDLLVRGRNYKEISCHIS